MISLNTALKLKKAGLSWQPAHLDFFAIPERNMDERIFVISDMLVTVDIIQGMQVVSFQGASEWALDSLVTVEAVWLPREDQLRQILEAVLMRQGWLDLRLVSTLRGYSCQIRYEGKELTFEETDASEAYAQALLYLLGSYRVTGAPDSVQ